MLCPSCNHKLLPVSLKGKMGPVVLDYCQICGGVWSDQGEINFVELKNLSPLFQLIPSIVRDSSQDRLLCPRDKHVLQLFRAESVPPDTSIFRCENCDGIFFPTATLPEFKKAQEAKVNYFKTWKIPLPSVYAVLLPLLLVLLIGGGLVATIGSFRQDTEVRTQAKDAFSRPLVYFPSSSTAQIHFTTSKNAATKIRYWTDPNLPNEAWVSVTQKTMHSITLVNLEVNQTYSYQLVMLEPEPAVSAIYTFSTTDL